MLLHLKTGVTDIKQRNADNKIRGQSSKRSGGVSVDEASNNIKEANADNEIRATAFAEIEVSFHGKLQTCPV